VREGGREMMAPLCAGVVSPGGQQLEEGRTNVTPFEGAHETGFSIVIVHDGISGAGCQFLFFWSVFTPVFYYSRSLSPYPSRTHLLASLLSCPSDTPSSSRT